MLLSADSYSSYMARPKIEFNAYDAENRIDRKSYYKTYEVIDGIPRNPLGRTGLIGRGNLSLFGPNRADQLLLTRKRTDSNDSKPEILMIIQKNKKFNLPKVKFHSIHSIFYISYL